MELEPDFALFFELRVGNVDDAETVQEGNGAIAASADGDFVPVLFALVADRLDELVVGAEPTAAGLVFTGGVPNTGLFSVTGDFVLAAA